jgi:hypothetical protein
MNNNKTDTYMTDNSRGTLGVWGYLLLHRETLETSSLFKRISVLSCGYVILPFDVKYFNN